MKKTKIISVAVAFLAVVALGVFMGKYMIKLMEVPTTQTNSQTDSSQLASNTNNQASVKVLYGDKQITSAEANQSAKPVEAPQASVKETPAQEKTTKPQENKVAETPKTETKEAPVQNNTLAFKPDGPRWYAFANTKGLNVRATPDVKGKFLFKVNKGTRGVVKEKKNGWTLIQWDFNKQKGWSIDEYLVQGPVNIFEAASNMAPGTNPENLKKEQLSQIAVEKAMEQSKTIVGLAKAAPASETVITYTNGKDLPQRGKISAQNGANIREMPTTQSNKLIKLPKGTTVGIKSVKKVDQHQWFEITYQNGTKVGWTREDNLQF